MWLLSEPFIHKSTKQEQPFELKTIMLYRNMQVFNEVVEDDWVSISNCNVAFLMKICF